MMNSQTSLMAIAVLLFAALSGCSYHWPGRPAFDPAIADNGTRVAFAWSEEWSPAGTTPRESHGAVQVGLSTTPGPGRTESLLGIDGPAIGNRVLTPVGSGTATRFHLAWQRDTNDILGQFRDSEDLSAIPGALPVSLVADAVAAGFAPALSSTDPVRLGFGGLAESVVEGLQYDLAYDEHSNTLLLAWRVRSGTQTKIAYRLIDMADGSLGTYHIIDPSDAGSDSWPSVSAGFGVLEEIGGYYLGYINEGAGGNAVYGVQVSTNGTILARHNLTATTTDPGGRGDHQRVAVAWDTGALTYRFLYDTGFGIASRSVSPYMGPPPLVESRVSTQETVLSPSRQRGRNTPILVSQKADSHEWLLAYYEQETAFCECSGADCACDATEASRERDRYVLYQQLLGPDMAPITDARGEIERLRLYPDTAGIFPLATTAGTRKAQWRSAGRADVAAASSPRVYMAEHVFEMIADPTLALGWRQDLSELVVHWLRGW